MMCGVVLRGVSFTLRLSSAIRSATDPAVSIGHIAISVCSGCGVWHNRTGASSPVNSALAIRTYGVPYVPTAYIPGGWRVELP